MATYKCTSCNLTGIPESQIKVIKILLIVPSEMIVHHVDSTVGGEGGRDCGPCELET